MDISFTTLPQGPWWVTAARFAVVVYAIAAAPLAMRSRRPLLVASIAPMLMVVAGTFAVTKIAEALSTVGGGRAATAAGAGEVMLMNAFGFAAGAFICGMFAIPRVASMIATEPIGSSIAINVAVALIVWVEYAALGALVQSGGRYSIAAVRRGQTLLAVAIAVLAIAVVLLVLELRRRRPNGIGAGPRRFFIAATVFAIVSVAMWRQFAAFWTIASGRD